MKTIKIKGENKGFVVSDEVGLNLREYKKQGKVGWVDLNGFSGDIADIRYIIDGVDEDNRSKYKQEEEEGRMKENNKVIDYNAEEYRNEIYKYLHADKNKKIDYNLRIASFYCYAFTGKWLKEYAKDHPEKIIDLKSILSQELDTQELIVMPRKYKRVFMLEDNQNKYDSRSFANRIMMGVI